MRKKVFLTLFFFFFLFNVISGVAIYYHISHSKSILVREIYATRLREFKTYLKGETLVLEAVANFLAKDPCVIDAYLKNDREELIKCTKPLYESFYEKGLIKELHFFKPPAISFVDFSNLKVFNVNLSKIRADILWIETTLKPSVHFYVCRSFAGLRVTQPIFYRGRLLGSFSFGVDIKNFADFFKNVVTKDVVVYLNDKLLREFLRPEHYKFYSKYPLYKGFRVLGRVYPITLKSGVETIGNLVFTKIKLRDFFKNTFAYLVAVDDISANLTLEYKTAMVLFSIFEFLFFTIFAAFWRIFDSVYKKFERLERIIDLIKAKKFDKLPKIVEIKDELDLFKYKLVELGEELKNYINLLVSEAQYYKNKAYLDLLTGVFNRNFLEERGWELFTKFKLQKIPVGVIMLDIDNFKKINDTYGHDVGDAVIKKLAEVIRRNLRRQDYVIRYGGEEFLILLPGATLEETYLVAEKLRKEVEKTSVKVGDKELKFTISLGITQIYPEDRNLFEAIKRADKKLYEAKKKGKNRVEL